MVDVRRQAYAQRAPVARERLEEGEAFALQKRWNQLSKRLQEQKTGADPLGLATTAEKQQWKKLNGIRDTLASLPAEPRYRAIRLQGPPVGYPQAAARA